jgi:biopolymer transport protein TolR
MAISMPRAGPGRGRYRPLAEINVTPLVDVMLVLLIIFMVAAPLMTVGVQVDLPRTRAPAINQDNEPISVTVRADGAVFFQDEEVGLDALVERLRLATQAGGAERRIFVRGDRNLNYGRVIEVMGTIVSGGFTRVALLAEQPSGAAPAPARPPTSQRPGAPRG